MNESDHNNRGTATILPKVPPLIKQVKDNAFSIIESKFNDFFASCDDLFFDLASKASTNNEQNLYFDSMREVRLKKNAVWDIFKNRYEKNFKELVKGQLSSEPKKSNPSNVLTMESMQLVDKDDMEQDVAITGIVNRARIVNQELLYQLNCRFDYLMPSIKVNENNNPLDPSQIVAGVNDAMKVLDLNIKCKVILLKHLDRTVMVELRSIYSLANELLVKAGILPQIRFDVKKNKSRQRPASQTSEFNEDAEVSESAFYENHGHYSGMSAGRTNAPGTMPRGTAADGNAPMGRQGLSLSEAHQIFGQLRDTGRHIPNGISHSAIMGSTPIRQEKLIDSLTVLQRSSDYVQSPQEFNIRSVVEKILEENKKQGKEDSLHESDEDIINLVAMFFDFVLDDRNLPVPFQALISRLQIPILKVALKDKQFFTSNKHPARRLVNDIAASAVGWDESQESLQDKLYKEANRVIHYLIENFTGDVEIFTQARESFQAAIKVDNNKAVILEKRTQEAAQGKAKAEYAREQCNHLLISRLRTAELPENVMTFLVKGWHKVLLYIHLKQSTESKEWMDAKQVIDQIIWAIRPHQDKRSLDRLQRIKNDILEKVSKGLHTVSISSESIDNTLSTLQECFDLVEAGRLDDSYLITLQPEHLMALGQSSDTRSKDWNELTAVERQKLKLDAVNKEFVAKASKIRPGTWFNYTAPNGAKSFRCKLAMITRPGENYVFVNRFGLRVFDKHLNEFATDLQKGNARKLESGVLFDRAMDNISLTLKKLAS